MPVLLDVIVVSKARPACATGEIGMICDVGVVFESIPALHFIRALVLHIKILHKQAME